MKLAQIGEYMPFFNYHENHLSHYLGRITRGLEPASLEKLTIFQNKLDPENCMPTSFTTDMFDLVAKAQKKLSPEKMLKLLIVLNVRSLESKFSKTHLENICKQYITYNPSPIHGFEIQEMLNNDFINRRLRIIQATEQGMIVFNNQFIIQRIKINLRKAVTYPNWNRSLWGLMHKSKDNPRILRIKNPNNSAIQHRKKQVLNGLQNGKRVFVGNAKITSTSNHMTEFQIQQNHNSTIMTIEQMVARDVPIECI